MIRWTERHIEIILVESLPPLLKEWTDGQMDRQTDRNIPAGKSTPSLERMDRWTDKNNPT